jgi:drug/metabolite transporter (DMT)-like permease
MSRRALVLFAAMAVIWGIPYLLIRVAVGEVSPPVLVFARTAIGAVILLPLAAVRTDLRPTLRHWKWIVAFAGVEIAGPWVLLGWAEQHVTSSLAGLLVAGVPLVGTVIAVATGGRDHVGRAGVAGLLLGLLGVALIAGFNLNASNAGAVGAIALVTVGYAVGPWILSRRLTEVPSLGVMAPSLALCALLYLPISLIVGWPAVVPSTGAVVSIAILGTVCTALAFVLFGELIAAVGPVRATVITYINPAVAAVLGVAILAEPFTPAMAVGFVLVISGSVLATRRPPVLVVAREAVPG